MFGTVVWMVFRDLPVFRQADLRATDEKRVRANGASRHLFVCKTRKWSGMNFDSLPLRQPGPDMHATMRRNNNYLTPTGVVVVVVVVEVVRMMFDGTK